MNFEKQSNPFRFKHVDSVRDFLLRANLTGKLKGDSARIINTKVLLLYASIDMNIFHSIYADSNKAKDMIFLCNDNYVQFRVISKSSSKYLRIDSDITMNCNFVEFYKSGNLKNSGDNCIVSDEVSSDLWLSLYSACEYPIGLLIRNNINYFCFPIGLQTVNLALGITDLIKVSFYNNAFHNINLSNVDTLRLHWRQDNGL